MSSLKIVYIAGCTHSGSTLVNRVLGAHPDILCIGGVKNLTAAAESKKNCSCGQTIHSCRFWRKVEESLNENGVTLSSLRVTSDDDFIFRRDNLILFEALRDASGCSVIIDTSRRPERLRRLLQIKDVQVFPLLVFKSARSQVASYRRKNIPFGGALRIYWKDNVSVLPSLLWSRKKLSVQYEFFCESPEYHINKLLGFLGLNEDHSLLKRWGNEEVHMIGGNRMLSSRTSDILSDESWRSRLSRRESILSQLFGFPVLVMCRVFSV